jgi:glycine cleavage system transcriptional repressor
VAHFAVIAIGADRPGIVAALTGALYESGGNLEDVACSILRGHFAIMLVVDAPVPADELERDLAAAAQPLGVTVSVRDVESGAPRGARATHTLVAYAADRPGIVAGLTGLLADRGVNVTDLTCRVTSEDPQVYVMVAELAVPEGAELSGEIEKRASDLGVDVSFRPIESDAL